MEVGENEPLYTAARALFDANPVPDVECWETRTSARCNCEVVGCGAPFKIIGRPKGGCTISAFLRSMDDGTSRGSPPASVLAERWASLLQEAGGERFRTEIRHLVSNDAVMEDVFQDAYERFQTQFSRGEPVSGGWLRTVVRNLSLDYWRQRKRYGKEIELSEGVSADETFSELSTDSTVIEDEIYRDEAMEKLWAAVETLLDDQKDLIDLHYWKGMAMSEIARIWRISDSALGQRLTRTLDRLRSNLAGDDGIDPLDLG